MAVDGHSIAYDYLVIARPQGPVSEAKSGRLYEFKAGKK